MGLESLIKLALALTIAAAAMGELPQATLAVHVAQGKLLHQMKASHWGSPDLLFSAKHRR